MRYSTSLLLASQKQPLHPKSGGWYKLWYLHIRCEKTLDALF